MSKYEVGDKVVYEVKEIIRDSVYLLSGWKESEPLSTYTEPLEAKIRRQAAEITRLLAENKKLKEAKTEDIEHWCDVCTKQSVIEQARAKGQKEAWELARKIVNMPLRAKRDIWGGETCLPTSDEIFTDTYPEAAAKVAQWEKAKEEIKVGDVVKCGEIFGVVMGVGECWLKGLTKEGTFSWHKVDCHKTGRHIDIDSFLKQIGEEE